MHDHVKAWQARVVVQLVQLVVQLPARAGQALPSFVRPYYRRLPMSLQMEHYSVQLVHSQTFSESHPQVEMLYSISSNGTKSANCHSIDNPSIEHGADDVGNEST